jgi:uncharacterized protein (UPF0179 family)
MPDAAKPKITIVGLKQAREGFSFVMAEPAEDCKNCELIGTCMNLEVGRVYTVVRTRNKVFPCRIHEEGVRVVEVEEPPIEAAIEQRAAFPLSVITVKPRMCKRRCENLSLCAPFGLSSDDRCQILEIRGRIECPLNQRLVRAMVKREQAPASP